MFVYCVSGLQFWGMCICVVGVFVVFVWISVEHQCVEGRDLPGTADVETSVGLEIGDVRVLVAPGRRGMCVKVKFERVF